MSGDSDHLGDAMHDFYSRDVEDDFDADRRWNAEMQRRALQQDRIALAKLTARAALNPTPTETPND